MANLPDPEWHARQLDEERQKLVVAFGGDRAGALNFALGTIVGHAIAIGVSIGAKEKADRDREQAAAGAKV